MKTIAEIKDILAPNKSDFESLIRDEAEREINGLLIKPETAFRTDAEYSIIFKIEDRLFRVDGSYDSWNGTEFYDILGSFYEVEIKKVVKSEYHAI